MPSYVTPKKNTEYIFYVSLVSQTNTKLFQVNPTLANGDVKVSTDGGAEGNIDALPVVTPAGSKRVKVVLSTSEMNGDNIQVTFSDAAGDEWADLTINIQTTANQIDQIPTTAMRGTDGALTDKAGFSLSTAGIKAIWDQLTAVLTTANSIGKLIVDNLNGTISSVLSRLPTVLVSGKMSSDAVAISGSTEAADNLEASAETIVTGAAIAGTLSLTEMTTNLTEVTNDHYNGRRLIWTSGVLQDQATAITDYEGTTKKLTYTGVTEAPSIGDTFNIV